jgi:hypothetical protein
MHLPHYKLYLQTCAAISYTHRRKCCVDLEYFLLNSLNTELNQAKLADQLSLLDRHSLAIILSILRRILALNEIRHLLHLIGVLRLHHIEVALVHLERILTSAADSVFR